MLRRFHLRHVDFDRRFQLLINIFPLDHRNWVASLVKKSAHRALIEIVALMLQAGETGEAAI